MSQGYRIPPSCFINRTLLKALCHALFYLADYPEYADVLREEVKGIVDREGWTYRAVNQMVKVKSFIRKSQRLNSLQCGIFLLMNFYHGMSGLPFSSEYDPHRPAALHLFRWNLPPSRHTPRYRLKRDSYG